MTDSNDTARSYEGHDLTVIGEPVLHAAKISTGWRSGVIALTDTRVVYLRKNKHHTFVHREHTRNAIMDVTYKRSWGQWQLEFNDRQEAIVYYAQFDDLEAFVQLLKFSSDENISVKDHPGPKHAGYDLTILNEPVLLGKRVPAGVIALTATKIALIKQDANKTYVSFDATLDNITTVSFEQQGQVWKIQIQEHDISKELTGARSDLEPFVEPLMRRAKAYEATRSTDSEIASLIYQGHDLGIIGGQVLLAAKVSGGRHKGVIALTEARLVYLRKAKDNTFIDREHTRNAITDVIYRESMGSWRLEFRDRSELIFYGQVADSLEPFVEPLARWAETNIAERAKYRSVSRIKSERIVRGNSTSPQAKPNNSDLPNSIEKENLQDKDEEDWCNPIHSRWRRCGCISAIVVVTLILMLLFCNPGGGYDCEREGDKLFSWDAGGVDDVLEYMERCE